MLPLFLPVRHQARIVTEDLQPLDGVNKCRAMRDTPRDPRRQRRVREPGQHLRDLAKTLDVFSGDRQHAEAQPFGVRSARRVRRTPQRAERLEQRADEQRVRELWRRGRKLLAVAIEPRK